ncbi:hypothetical protein DCC62_06600 [candidate division KSB1 bacterium]|nr:MAG: hypothetical protein DCC62_06600 [candidate division KSB1 bacterium]
MPRTEDREKVQGRVFDLLKGLRGEHQLKELCRELNYEHRNTSLSPRNWRSAAAQKLVEEKRLAAPVLLASAGNGGDFQIIYTRLQSPDLRLAYERQVVSQLLQDHPYALFVFSNAEQDRWHFLNVKYHEQAGRHSRIFRRIAVGGHDRLYTAAKRLAMLDLETLVQDSNRLSPLSIQKAHDDAFNVEAVTATFFAGDARTGEKGYKQIFDDLQQALCKQTKDRVWAHDYAMQFLNRIMFLYFIQRKQWLGDNPEFLRSLWQSYQKNGKTKDGFVNRWLKVLFFEAFNCPFNARRGDLNFFPPPVREAVSGAPFLNGGLFKPNELDEPQGLKFVVSDAIFENCFSFFERYNFTISEISPLDQEVAVDAEMLSKVYESLVNVSVEANEQGDNGTFYTPRTEIDLMCRLALVDNFTNHLGQQHKHLLYNTIFALEEDEKIAADAAMSCTKLWQPFDTHLRQLAVLDPACGSGSFLIGMLYLLHDLQARADQQLGKQERPFDRKKRIIAENLYGVDVMKWITQETELGLWLNLVVGAPFSRAELRRWVKPLLPNFDCKIRRGDSLVQEIGGVNLGHRRAGYEIPAEIKSQINHLQREKLKFYYSEAGGQIHSEKEARRYEHQIFFAILQKREEMLHARLKILRQKISGPQSRQLRLDGAVEPRSHQLDLQAAEWQQQLESIQADLEGITRTRAALGKDVPPERLYAEDHFVWDVAFAEILAGERNGFDIVIGNPPYVRSGKIVDPRLPSDEVTKANKLAYKAKLAKSVYQAFPNFFGYKPAKGGTAAWKLDGNSDLYVYFYFHALSLLNPRGSFCFITSNSWLDVGYGAELQEFLLKHCHVKLVLDNQVQRTFGQADVNTVIVLFSAPDEAREWGLEQTARFVMFKQPFDSVASASIFQQIESINVRQTTSDFRIHPARQQNLLADGSETAHSQTCAPEHLVSSKDVKRKSAHTGPLIKVERYLGDKWGGKYLRAPDIYWTILKKGKSKLVRLGDIAEVRRGFTTGANEFFYLDEARIREWGIEREFLKPVIVSPRECASVEIRSRDMQVRAFVCHKDKNMIRGTNALEYIAWGEKQRFNQRPSCRSRKRWYDFPERQWARVLWPMMHNDRQNVFWNRDSVLVDHNLFEILGFDNDITWGSLAWTGQLLFRELYGRTNLGQGALKTEGVDIKLFHVLGFRADSIIESIRFSRERMAQRIIGPVSEESQADDRRTLDNIFFEALDFTQGEREAVYEAVISLVASRLKRAKSLKPKNRHEHDEDDARETTLVQPR